MLMGVKGFACCSALKVALAGLILLDSERWPKIEKRQVYIAFPLLQVEPAGLIPMELMLDHYRRAAMNGSSGGGQGGVASNGCDVTSPRGGIQQPLADSTILQGRIDLQTQILKWYVAREPLFKGHIGTSN